MRSTKEILQQVGKDVLCLENTLSNSRLKEIYKSNFGCSLVVVYQLWNILIRDGLLPCKGKMQHLYWALSFLKSYGTETVYAVRYHTTEKNFRTWVIKFVLAISYIEIVSTNQTYESFGSKNLDKF
jgi:hypothetical protein